MTAIRIFTLFVLRCLPLATNAATPVAMADGLRLHLSRTDDSLPLIVFVDSEAVRVYGRAELRFKIQEDEFRALLDQAVGLCNHFSSSEDDHSRVTFFVGVWVNGEQSSLFAHQSEYRRTEAVAGILGMFLKLKELSRASGDVIGLAIAELLEGRSKAQ